MTLYIAAFLLVAIGIAHSYLGERYILVRLFRRDNLPKLFGSADFTIRTLRFVWHLLTVAWWGFAAILIIIASPSVNTRAIGLVIGVTFFVHFTVAFFASRARHLSWTVFLAIAILVFFTT